MSAASLPWANWPWQQCRAVVVLDGVPLRCELRHKHKDTLVPHRRERGMFHVVWEDHPRVVNPFDPAPASDRGGT